MFRASLQPPLTTLRLTCNEATLPTSCPRSNNTHNEMVTNKDNRVAELGDCIGGSNKFYMRPQHQYPRSRKTSTKPQDRKREIQRAMNDVEFARVQDDLCFSLSSGACAKASSTGVTCMDHVSEIFVHEDPLNGCFVCMNPT